MATSGQFTWPSVGSSMAAHGQFFMAANRKTVRSLQTAHETQVAYAASGVDAARKPGNLNQWTNFGPGQVGDM